MLRALGHGFHVGVVQFIKGAWETGERKALDRFGDQVDWHTMGEGFTWETQDLSRDMAAAERAWAKAKELMADDASAFWCSTSSTSPCATISGSGRGGRGAEGAPA